MRLRGLLTLALVAALGAAAPAAAHVDIKSSSPGKNRTVSKSLRSVKITFSGPLRRGTLTVRGPGARTVSVNSGGRDPRNVSRLLVELKRGLKAGKYTARYTLVGSDGHRQSGSYSFRLR